MAIAAANAPINTTMIFQGRVCFTGSIGLDAVAR
jgi:hypothetical protein